MVGKVKWQNYGLNSYQLNLGPRLIITMLICYASGSQSLVLDRQHGQPWELVRKTKSLAIPDLLWERNPAICVLTSRPGAPKAHENLRTTMLDWNKSKW